MKFNKLFSLGIIAVITIIFVGCKDKAPVAEDFKLPSRVIKKIVVDNNGIKWIATGKGIVSYDGKLWTTYTGNEVLNNIAIDELAFGNASGKDEMWLGSKLGATSFEYTASKIGSLATYNVQQGGILADSVRAIGIDQTNVKYIGTSKGLSILKGNNWDHFMGRKGEEILSKYKISAVATTTNGWIYVSTKGGGVSRFKYTDAVSGATTFSQPWAGDLSSDSVFTVIVVNDNYQWYGTNKGASLHTSEYTKADWVHYSRVDGLICDSVYAIGKDLTGNIWFGTPKGVSKLSGTTWENFTTKNGLIADKVNTIAIDLDGSVWFGTDNGISHYKNNEWFNF